MYTSVTHIISLETISQIVKSLSERKCLSNNNIVSSFERLSVFAFLIALILNVIYWLLFSLFAHIFQTKQWEDLWVDVLKVMVSYKMWLIMHLQIILEAFIFWTKLETGIDME